MEVEAAGRLVLLPIQRDVHVLPPLARRPGRFELEPRGIASERRGASRADTSRDATGRIEDGNRLPLGFGSFGRLIEWGGRTHVLVEERRRRASAWREV